MPNPTWPASLPQHFDAGSFRETPPETVLRTQMTVGPPAARRISTAGVRRVEGVLSSMTGTQMETFDAFLRTTLEDGALRFDWVHPRTQAVVTMRFADTPEYRARRASGGVLYDVAVKLDILP